MLRIRRSDDSLLCQDGQKVVRKPLGSLGIARLQGWTTDYATAVRSRNADSLLAIGQNIADFLNDGDGWLNGCLKRPGPVCLEIEASADPDDGASLLLDVPWELLALQGRFLAADPHQLFLVARRLGASETPDEPEHGDLAVLFMAAEVEGQHVLDYEREEAAFLDATQGLNAHLAVEESGSLAGLGLRLKQTRRWEALHLTCHGDLGETGPFLALETAEGGLDRVDAGQLCALLGDETQMPRLVFLSACRTAERAESGAARFAQALVRAGVGNAVGWDGSVQDGDAIAFAEVFYGELAGGRSVIHAAAVARRKVLGTYKANGNEGDGIHWHLARVYLGPRGGGALCNPSGKPTRPFHRNPADKAYLDKTNRRVPVATADQFVGRRRPLQAALRAWSAGSAGVLIQGMGNLGKSSLAERIASRLDSHDVVVVVERYDALAVFNALVAALPETEQAAIAKAYEASIVSDPASLKLVVQKLLKDPFSGHGGTRPILLIIDDLEQRLDAPKPGESATPFKTPDDNVIFGALIAAFCESQRHSKSRLLITSRYTFALRDAQGDDLAARLTVIALPPMDPAQRAKQMRTAARLNGRLRRPGADPDLDQLEGRIRAAAGGNPGLQEILTRPLLEMGDRAAATRAVEAVEGYLISGKAPSEDSAAQEFFQRVSLEALRAMLTLTEVAQLRAATLFPLEVPLTVVETAGRAAGIDCPDQAVERLQGLGLLDRYQGPGGRLEAAVNPLARPLVEPLSATEQTFLAAAVVEKLYAAWTNDDGQLSANAQAVVLADLALIAGGPPEILKKAIWAGVYFLRWAGWLAEAEALLYHAVQSFNHLGDKHARATAWGQIAEILVTRAKMDTALHIFCEEVMPVFEGVGYERERAVTLTKIADILDSQGKTDRALCIYLEQCLPVVQQMRDLSTLAHIRLACAKIRLKKSGLQNNEAVTIVSELSESFDLFCQIDRLDYIGKVGLELGQVLAKTGQIEEAVRVLEQAAEAFTKLLNRELVENIRTLQASIRKPSE
ncbi:CHAT domain-containing protein [Rhodospirillum rubrum]|nr:CHAT domain-containing protein [Rhodospirillum rubrum]